MNEIDNLKKQVIEGAIMCRDKGLIHGTSGNVSMACREQNKMVITPSSIPYEELTLEKIPVLDLTTGEWQEGECRPSVEACMHRKILQAKPKMEAVVHTHSLFATVMSILVDELPSVAAASTPYSPTKVAPFEIPGSEEIADSAVKAMGDNNIACLLEHHGLIAAGPTLNRAISIAEYIEENAQTAYYVYLAGNMKEIPHDAYQIMHDRAVRSMGLI